MKVIVTKSRVNRPRTTKLVVGLHVDTIAIHLLLLVEHETSQHALVVIKPPSIIILPIDIESYGLIQFARRNIGQAVLSTGAVEETLEVDGPTINKWQPVSEITPDVIVSQQ